MMIFASPDFGAGGVLMLILLVGCTVPLGLTIVCILEGLRLRRGETRRDKVSGNALIVFGVLIPLACYFGPPLYVRATTGSFPLRDCPFSDTIRTGMTMDEVRAELGPPHRTKNKIDRSTTWSYMLDSFGMELFVVEFGPDGTVI